uniref:G-protein coupled receptors family 1 profile domain-containing protein n=1 Tax=Pyxicephalus adspersus TaxID=30357 RepID=A0AAV2ZZJ5_PYXAD|nr:TPA: hypothetical protein GDO54_017489 [Pyxicephalus adspersus]
MEDKNTTSEFIILGFNEWPHLQLTLFVIFLLIFLRALTGKMTQFVVITSSSKLHTPIYFFSDNVSILGKIFLHQWMSHSKPIVLTVLAFRCSFTKSNIINNLICDIDFLLKFSSGDTHKAQMAVLVLGFISGIIPMTFILITYALIIHSILEISSRKAKQNAFSTCSSQLTMITFFFAIFFRMYMRPNSDYSIMEGKILFLLYTCCLPMVNPVIYCLRNNDVHTALEKPKKTIYVSVVIGWENFHCNCRIISF